MSAVRAQHERLLGDHHRLERRAEREEEQLRDDCGLQRQSQENGRIQSELEKMTMARRVRDEEALYQQIKASVPSQRERLARELRRDKERLQADLINEEPATGKRICLRGAERREAECRE
jgi:hypothetical protein